MSPRMRRMSGLWMLWMWSVATSRRMPGLWMLWMLQYRSHQASIHTIT